MEENIELLKYPIGKFHYTPGGDGLASAIESMNSLPSRLRSVVASLTMNQLDTPYREGGWTLRQVIHHLPDSHMNAYIRLKMAITEVNPEVRPYDEGLWAECEDAKHGDIEMSLALLDSLHQRLVAFLRSLDANQFERTYYHPAYKKESKLIEVVGMYAWHGEHHLAHITSTISRNKW